MAARVEELVFETRRVLFAGVLCEIWSRGTALHFFCTSAVNGGWSSPRHGLFTPLREQVLIV
jgi:hypothetical protein